MTTQDDNPRFASICGTLSDIDPVAETLIRAGHSKKEAIQLATESRARMRDKSPLEPTDDPVQAAFERWALTCDGNCDRRDLVRYAADSNERRHQGLMYVSELVQRDWDVWLARGNCVID
jgi:hypothetical protein